VRQGVTTEVLGEGRSAGPFKGKVGPKRLEVSGKTLEWDTLGGYFALLEKQGVSVNVASFVGLDNLWEGAVGKSHARPGKEEFAAMKALLEEALADGAFGLSTMLAMPPGSLAQTDDIVDLSKVVAKRGGIYSSHIRHEGIDVIKSVKEAISIGERAGLR